MTLVHVRLPAEAAMWLLRDMEQRARDEEDTAAHAAREGRMSVVAEAIHNANRMREVAVALRDRDVVPDEPRSSQASLDAFLAQVLPSSIPPTQNA